MYPPFSALIPRNTHSTHSKPEVAVAVVQVHAARAEVQATGDVRVTAVERA